MPSSFWQQPSHHGSQKRAIAAPISVHNCQTAPIFEYVVPLCHPQASVASIGGNCVRSESYCVRNTRFWKNFDRKIMVSSFFHHGDEAPQWRAWGPPTGPIPVPVRPYSGIRCFMMYINADQRAKSIGGFIGDEIMITMGDVSWIYKKVYLVPGTNLKN